MRKILIVIFLIVFQISAQSQISKMFFVSGGMSILTDVLTTSSSLDNKGAYSLSYQHLQVNLVSLNVLGRMNIANLGENATISLSTAPTVGVGMAYALFDSGTWYSFGSSIPGFIEINFGAASRYACKKDLGFVLGAGYEYNIYPIWAYRISDTQLAVNEFKKDWSQMVFEAGIRYYNKKNRVNEINFKLGYGEKGKEFINFEGNTEKEKQTMSFRLSFLRILNY